MFPTAELTATRRPIVITDQLGTPADFLLHRTVISHLKLNKTSRCVLLSISNDLPRWRAVSAKSSVNIDQLIQSGLFKFIDLVPYLQPPNSSISPLLGLFQEIKAYTGGINEQESQLLVVFDDTSSLEWLGHSLVGLTRFLRTMCALCNKSNHSLLFRHHVLNPEEPDDTLRQLLQIVSYHVEVLPLSSGKSGAVSGEIALHAGPTQVNGQIHTIPRSQALQYRLTDYGAVFFDKGTGGGLL